MKSSSGRGEPTSPYPECQRVVASIVGSVLRRAVDERAERDCRPRWLELACRWLRYASGSGFDTWDLVGSLAALVIGALVHLVLQLRRKRKKGRTPVNSSWKTQCTGRSKENRRKKYQQYALEAVNAAGADVSGDRLAS